MNRVKYTEWIDSYLEGEMDPGSMHEFESSLGSDKELALEYKLELDLHKALADEEILDFRAKCFLAQEETRIATSVAGKVIHFTRKYWYAAASVILIALIAGGVTLFNPGGYSAEKLFKMYYKSGETMEFRSGNVTVAEALLAFGQNDFVTANQLFDQILLNDPDNYAVLYYKGISNIELKNFQEAIRLFEVVIADQNNLYTEYADWYLGLSYLAAEQPGQASAVFTRIMTTKGHLYEAEAVEILDKMDKGEKSKKFLNNLFFLILPF